jgi:small subunit ribosomal protein S6
MPSDKKEAVIAEDVRAHDYDLVIIFSPELADDALEAAINNVSQFITGKGGTITKLDRWGKKKLAYPLKHFLEGNYILVKFKMNTKSGRELEAHLHIQETVLRHLLINPDE